MPETEGVHALPRWEELPDLELYMDQVLGLIERYLGALPGFDGRGLTASMVNNYVKLGVMPAPVRKRYTRTHLAHLIMICSLKSVLPIASVQALLAAGLREYSEERFYNGFCTLFEQAAGAAAKAAEELSGGSPVTAVLYAAMRSRAEQALALTLFERLAPTRDPSE